MSWFHILACCAKLCFSLLDVGRVTLTWMCIPPPPTPSCVIFKSQGTFLEIWHYGDLQLPREGHGDWGGCALVVVLKSDDSQGPRGSENKLIVIIEQLIFIKPLLPSRHYAKGLTYIISFNLHTIPMRYLPLLSHLQIEKLGFVWQRKLFKVT